MACCGNCAKGVPCTKTCSGCASSPNPPAGLGITDRGGYDCTPPGSGPSLFNWCGPAVWGGALRTAHERCFITCDYDPVRAVLLGGAAAGVAYWRKAPTPFVLGTGLAVALGSLGLVVLTRFFAEGGGVVPIPTTGRSPQGFKPTNE